MSPTPPPGDGPLLRVRDLRTEFRMRRGTVHAVNGISFDVAENELVGVVGETGCGKSATVRSIVGLVRPPGYVVGGEVLFRGQDLRPMPGRRLRRLRGSQIGFVPQNPFGALNPILRIERQFRNIIGAHRDVSREECRAMAVRMLEHVGISDPARLLDGYAHELSGGMAQRTVIAMAMILDPALVVADEPTTGLDVTVQRQILDLIEELLTEQQRAMLLITHDLGVVAQYCDSVVVMYAGKIVERGPVRTVFGAPAHPYTEALLAAIPRPGQELVSIRGRVPDLVHYPQGCPFYERCPYQDDERCATEEPPLRQVGEDHWAAVFYKIAQERQLGAV